jgi:hypothetical protein
MPGRVKRSKRNRSSRKSNRKVSRGRKRDVKRSTKRSVRRGRKRNVKRSTKRRVRGRTKRNVKNRTKRKPQSGGATPAEMSRDTQDGAVLRAYPSPTVFSGIPVGTVYDNPVLLLELCNRKRQRLQQKLELCNGERDRLQQVNDSYHAAVPADRRSAANSETISTAPGRRWWQRRRR